MKLYEVNQQIMSVLDQIDFDPETGEINCDIDSLMAELDGLQMEKKRILEYLAKVVLNNRAESAALKAEEKRLKGRRERLDKKSERIVNIIDRECDGIKTDLGVATVSYRKTSSLVVDDSDAAVDWLEAHNLSQCYTQPEAYVNKTETKKLINSGVEVPGCHLMQDRSCSLK